MVIFSPFQKAKHYQPAVSINYHGLAMAARFTDAAEEYRHAREQAALFDRGNRGFLLVTGRDRKAWLHNLITNDVKKLEDGQGRYAFAVDVRGRVQFDLNVLARPDALWLDLDFLKVDAAQKHLDRMLITEDAQLKDARGDVARLGVAGPRAAEVARWLGVSDLTAMPALSSIPLPEHSLLLFRNDFTGLPGFELSVPGEKAAEWWDRLAAVEGVRPAGLDTLNVLRIEAGLPWLDEDIDDKTLPPETGQIERGISYHKGCYLGQEVLERMRSHGSLARRLVRLTLENGEGLNLSAALRQNGAEVGRLTSLAKHPIEPYWVGLGYLKSKIQDYTNIAAGDPPRVTRILGPVAH